jgi:dihydroorotase
MDIIIRQIRIIDPSSPFHQLTADILIQNGIITEIGTVSRNASQEINIPGLHVSPGWLDVFAQFCDPGFEFRETLESGAAAAAAGGYTDVMLMPNTAPVVHNKSGVEYLIQKSKTLPVNILPISAATRNAEGKELSEMYDMHASGAVAFSDGTSSIQSSGVMLKALQYIKAIDKTLIQLPNDKTLSAAGLMHEGVISTSLGLPGIPPIAEELMIARDIELLRYTASRLHVTGISTAKSLALIKKAKEEGLKISCSVTPAHLCFTDADLQGYDTNFKLSPPLRTAEDREALRIGVQDGTIDCIASHHLPWDIDHKIVEFQSAADGMTSLESAFGVVGSCLPHLPITRLVELFSFAPKAIFNLHQPCINKDSMACLTLFSPDEEWTFMQHYSRSVNTPFNGKKLKGKPYGIINHNKLFLNQ